MNANTTTTFTHTLGDEQANGISRFIKVIGRVSRYTLFRQIL